MQIFGRRRRDLLRVWFDLGGQRLIDEQKTLSLWTNARETGLEPAASGVTPTPTLLR
jgi:hypothetical protein